MLDVTVPASLFVDEGERVCGDGGVLVRVVVAPDVLGYLWKGRGVSIPFVCNERCIGSRNEDACCFHIKLSQT